MNNIGSGYNYKPGSFSYDYKPSSFKWDQSHVNKWHPSYPAQDVPLPLGINYSKECREKAIYWQKWREHDYEHRYDKCITEIDMKNADYNVTLYEGREYYRYLESIGIINTIQLSFKWSQSHANKWHPSYAGRDVPLPLEINYTQETREKAIYWKKWREHDYEHRYDKCNTEIDMQNADYNVRNKGKEYYGFLDSTLMKDLEHYPENSDDDMSEEL